MELTVCWREVSLNIVIHYKYEATAGVWQLHRNSLLRYSFHSHHLFLLSLSLFSAVSPSWSHPSYFPITVISFISQRNWVWNQLNRLWVNRLLGCVSSNIYLVVCQQLANAKKNVRVWIDCGGQLAEYDTVWTRTWLKCFKSQFKFQILVGKVQVNLQVLKSKLQVKM